MIELEVGEILEILRNDNVESVKNMKQLEVYTGVVKSTNPLSVMVNQKFMLKEPFITVPFSFTDYEVKIEIEGGGMRNMKVYNSIKIGERLILLRYEKGQRFLVLDRVRK